MLTRIYIHNYCSLVNFELHPGRIGLLIGYNGAGKTSVFAVLGAICGLLREQWETGEAFSADTLTSFLHEDEQRFELDFESPHGSVKYVLVLDYNRDEETCRISHEELRAGSERLYWYSDGNANITGASPTTVNTFPFVSDRSFLAMMEVSEHTKPALLWFRTFMRSVWILRLNPQAANAVARKDVQGLDADGANFPAWFRHIVLGRREQLQDAETALREILPGFRSLNLQAAGRVRVLVARFEGPDRKSHDIDFDKLSDGQRALIILYVVLHVIKNQAGLLCIDEPDNFVAIREIQPFLVELTKACDDAGRQALLISHSAEVIDFFGPSEALLLERPGGGVTRVGEIRADSGLKLSELLARGWHGAR